ncbi:DNA-binding transcriptional regulator, CsgD family [Roseovarius lutimaris]|uniref:DNA-binding transcriptional regulator, CsgD family n=1 Tax=Roseovarius lutimaris TaxID=1005928 RepID=A0A1I5FCD2_9RHOB|nr:LuxR family transcriptional regulator [Roseovarius lutimaris]SFO21414.1 DNA-binding transcriptional regulator, CsgD family [Roseovarius lutimaris]
MHKRIDLIDLAGIPEVQRDYVGHLNKLCDTLGVEHATYFAANPISGKMHGFTTYPDDWKSHYVAHRLQEYDPTLNSASRSVAPVDWRRLTSDPEYDRVFKDAHDFKLPSQGVTVPIRGMFGEIGLLCACSSVPQAEWIKLKRDILGSLLNNAVHLHDTVMNSDPLLKTLRQPKLSSREIEILQWVAAGKSQQDIGDILMISSRTVEVHMRSTREKLCTISTAQAVGRAVSLGLIQPG